MAEHRITGVRQGRPRADGTGAEILVDTTNGGGILSIDTEALVSLGGICLHAATNAPLGEGEAIPVPDFQHQGWPDGSQTIGFVIPTGHTLWFSLDGTALAALQEFLAISTGSGPAPEGPVN